MAVIDYKKIRGSSFARINATVELRYNVQIVQDCSKTGRMEKPGDTIEKQINILT